jgi:PAS domain-containing protein
MEQQFGVLAEDLGGQEDGAWIGAVSQATARRSTGRSCDSRSPDRPAPASSAGVAVNVTDLQQAQEQLAESERRYRHLVENSQGLICTHDMDGRLLSVNQAALP